MLPRSPLVSCLHDRRGQQARFNIIHAHAVHARTFHALEPLFYCLESRLVPAGARLDVLHALLNVVEALLDAHQALGHVVAQAVQLVGEGTDRCRQGSILLAGGAGGDARLVVVPGLLQGEAPLVAQLHLADGLCTERTVNLARRGVALLGGAVVLDAAAIADEVVAGGLAVAVVGGAELDDAVALVLRDALDRRHQVVKRPEDALWRRQQRRRGGIRHRDELSHGGERERRGPVGRVGKKGALVTRRRRGRGTIERLVLWAVAMEAAEGIAEDEGPVMMVSG